MDGPKSSPQQKTPYMQGTCKQYIHLACISRGNHKLNGHLLKVRALQKKEAMSTFALKNRQDNQDSDE